MSHLILVRHGQSVWNLENRFTGWVDVELSKNGREEASKAGKLIKNLKKRLSVWKMKIFYLKLARVVQKLKKYYSKILQIMTKSHFILLITINPFLVMIYQLVETL